MKAPVHYLFFLFSFIYLSFINLFIFISGDIKTMCQTNTCYQCLIILENSPVNKGTEGVTLVAMEISTLVFYFLHQVL